MIDPGGLRSALAALIVLLVAMLGERLAIGSGFAPYFALSLPLPEEPLPLVRVPEATEGVGPTLGWSRDGLTVRWWVETRGAPRGLHGTARLEPSARGVRVHVRWFPAWPPLVAAVWMAGLGAWRGELPLAGSIALAIVVGVFVLHRPFAARAATELRFLLSGDAVP